MVYNFKFNPDTKPFIQDNYLFTTKLDTNIYNSKMNMSSNKRSREEHISISSKTTLESLVSPHLVRQPGIIGNVLCYPSNIGR